MSKNSSPASRIFIKFFGHKNSKKLPIKFTFSKRNVGFFCHITWSETHGLRKPILHQLYVSVILFSELSDDKKILIAYEFPLTIRILTILVVNERNLAISARCPGKRSKCLKMLQEHTSRVTSECERTCDGNKKKSAMKS